MVGKGNVSLGGGKARLRHRIELCWEVRIDALSMLELVPAICEDVDGNLPNSQKQKDRRKETKQKKRKNRNGKRLERQNPIVVP
jgi:hypothetical protein